MMDEIDDVADGETDDAAEGAMSEDEIQSIVAAEIEDAISYIDTVIAPDRAEAVDYYHGRPFGDEEDGRSQVVSRDVHDMIQAAMPSLMRIFFGPEKVVEFEGHGEEDEPLAQQVTDYITYIVTQDNDGLKVFFEAIKNALREKVGFVKWRWDESIRPITRRFSGLDQMALAMLQQANEGKTAEITVEQTETDGVPTFSATVKLKAPRDRAIIEAVPPEELLISRDGKTIDGARMVAHRTMKTVSDLVAMGLDRETVEAAAQDGDDLAGSMERLARQPNVNTFADTVGGDPSMRLVLYVEAYPYLDCDDDGIAELRRVCTVGPSYTIVDNIEVEERPFADFHVDPEPHAFFGESLADKTMDVQLIKSRVLRAGLDNLALANFPRMRVGKSGNLDDAMNTEIGAILRGEAGDYEPIIVPDLSQAAMPYLSYMDELRENRTGMSKVSMGLDAQALQNTTAAAAESQFTRSQERIELFARILASGARRLYRGLLHLVVENQRQARTVRLRNKWVPIDPSTWNTDMDVKCTLGLGGGSPQEKMARLSVIAGKQELIIQTLGPDNALVDLGKYRHTLAKMIELGGENPDAFFTDPDSDEGKQKAAALAQQPPKPDPKMQEVQGRIAIEQEKAKAGAELDQARAAHGAEMAQAQADADAQLARAKADVDAELAHAKIESDERVRFRQVDGELQLKREQVDAELQLKREQLQAELDLKREQMQAELALAAATQTQPGAVSAQVGSDVQPGGEPG